MTTIGQIKSYDYSALRLSQWAQKVKTFAEDPLKHGKYTAFHSAKTARESNLAGKKEDFRAAEENDP